MTVYLKYEGIFKITLENIMDLQITFTKTRVPASAHYEH